MAWSSSGSLADRLRAVRVRDDIIRKQDPNMGALGEMGMDGGLQGVQPVQAEAAAAAGLGGGIPGQGTPPKSDVGVALDSLLEPFIMMDQNLAQTKLLIDRQGKAGVLPDNLEELENDLMDLEQILMKIKQGIRRMITQHASLAQHDAEKTVSPAANEVIGGAAQ